MTDPGYMMLIGATFTLMFIFSQRIETGSKRGFRMFIVLMILFLFLMRYNRGWETLLGVIIALVVSFLFWLLIGRYNPPASSDEIKVFGMDD